VQGDKLSIQTNSVGAILYNSSGTEQQLIKEAYSKKEVSREEIAGILKVSDLEKELSPGIIKEIVGIMNNVKFKLVNSKYDNN